MMSRQEKGSYITPLSGFSRFGKKIYIYINIHIFISTQMFGINRIHDWKL